MIVVLFLVEVPSICSNYNHHHRSPLSYNQNNTQLFQPNEIITKIAFPSVAKQRKKCFNYEFPLRSSYTRALLPFQCINTNMDNHRINPLNLNIRISSSKLYCFSSQCLFHSSRPSTVAAYIFTLAFTVVSHVQVTQLCTAKDEAIRELYIVISCRTCETMVKREML